MESDDYLEFMGFSKEELTFDRFRTPDQSLSENGRGCRILHRPSGNTIVSTCMGTYHGNRNVALVKMVSVIDIVTKGHRPNTPILDLLAQYENETCDFEDGKRVADLALRVVNTMDDSHLRAMVYALANIVKGTPYRRPVPLKEPVSNVEMTYTVCKERKDQIYKRVLELLPDFTELTLSFKIRRTNNKSGSHSKIYGSYEIRTRESRRVAEVSVIRKAIAKAIQEQGELSFKPYIYCTSGSMGFSKASETFRVVCEGEEEYNMWTRS